MERLTFEGLFCDIAKCDSTPGGTFCESGTCTQRRVWERLKEYEDTGLVPEQVLELKSFMQGGIHKVDDGWKHVQDLLQAEQDGRLVVLPFPQGRTLVDYSDPQRPELLKNFRIAVASDHCGIIFHQPFNIFLENVRVGYIASVTKEAEAALAQKGASE